MVKRLNLWGKILHIYSALFPLYIYWAFTTFSKNIWASIALGILAIISVIVFYKILIKKGKNPDKEFNIRTSGKKSEHLRYVIGSLSPFILFLLEFIQNAQVENIGSIVGTVFFIIIGTIMVFKEDSGILYNLFYLPYHILNVQTKNEENIIIVTKKENLTGHVKTTQLDKKVFIEWN